jgi:anti-sigma B factor antagonist
LEISSKQRDGLTVIAITGSIDALTAHQVTQHFDQELESGNTRLVVDLSGVDFMSSAGLRAMLASLKQSRQAGGDLCLAAPQPDVERILKMSGFTSILKTYASVDEALADF